MILLEKSKIWTHLQKLPKNGGDLGKIIVARGFKKLPKVQLITESGHTDDGQSAFNWLSDHLLERGNGKIRQFLVSTNGQKPFNAKSNI